MCKKTEKFNVTIEFFVFFGKKTQTQIHLKFSFIRRKSELQLHDKDAGFFIVLKKSFKL